MELFAQCADQENTKGLFTMGTRESMLLSFSVTLPNGLIGNMYGPFDKISSDQFSQTFVLTNIIISGKCFVDIMKKSLMYYAIQ